MIYKPSDSYYKEFTTQRFDTGVVTDADSLPSASATKNGTADGSFSLTVTNLATGHYKVDGTVPGGYVTGDVVNITASATVNSVAGKQVVDTFIIDSSRNADLSTKIDSDAVLVNANHTKTQSDVALNATGTSVDNLSTKIDSDAVINDANHVKTQSDIALVAAGGDATEAKQDIIINDIAVVSTKIDSDAVLNDANHVKTQSDVALNATSTSVSNLSIKIDSDAVINDDNHVKTQSDVALNATSMSVSNLSTKIDSDTVINDANHVKTQSDVADLSTKVDSDAVVDNTNHVKTQSDVTLNATGTSVADLSTKIDSDAVVDNANHVKTQSDVALVSTKMDSDAVLAEANHDKTQSDVALVANQARDAVFAQILTAGGATFAEMMPAIHSMARGKIVKIDNDFAFYDDDDTTLLFTLNLSAGSRTVS